MSGEREMEPEVAAQLDRAVERLRAEWRHFENGDASDMENALQELNEVIARIGPGGLRAAGKREQSPVTNAICELEAVRGKLVEQLDGTADSLRATQGQRRAISAYAKANRS